MSKLIGKSVNKNSRPVKFMLQLRTVSPHPCRISWMTIKRNISPWPMKNGVTSCPLFRLKTTGKGQQPRSRSLPLLDQPPYLKATDLSGSQGRRRLLLVSCAPTKDPTERRLSIMLPSAITCFARTQECLSESICRIVPRTTLAHAPTRPSRIE